MEGFITALTGADGISANALWSTVTNVVPMIVVAVLFALGFGIVRRMTKGVSKGKVR